MLTPLNEDTVYKVIKAIRRNTWSSADTPAGLLVTLSSEGTTDVAHVLRASGYTVTEIDAHAVLVGGVDRRALLEAQIAALTAERDALVRPDPEFVPKLTPEELR